MALGVSSLKVLCVDDEVNILKALQRLFMDEEFEVLTASSGLAGVELLRDNDNIAVILSDQRMPEMSGVEFLEFAKEISPDAIRIVLTGYADIHAAVDAINRGGAYRYLAKPWDDKELLLTVQQAINFYKLKEENARFAKIIQTQNKELEDWNNELEAKVDEQTRSIKNANQQLTAANSRLTAIFDNTIAAFANLVELRDRKLSNHSRNVAVTVEIALEEFDFDEKAQKDLRYAALLHDIGKIGVSDLLLKMDRDKMTQDEQREYLQHAIRGQSAVDSIDELRDVGVLIRHHHERFDGTGFPDRLSGRNIPAGAMLIAMADFIDTLVRKGTGVNPAVHALNKLKNECGTAFDPAFYLAIENAVKASYSTGQNERDMIELEMSIRELMPGMLLSREARSGTGVLLLSKGVKLDQNNIRALKRYYQLDPPRHGVYVWQKA